MSFSAKCILIGSLLAGLLIVPFVSAVLNIYRRRNIGCIIRINGETHYTNTWECDATKDCVISIDIHGDQICVHNENELDKGGVIDG